MCEIRFIDQSHEILELTRDPIGSISRAARTCYRSEANSGAEADMRLVKSLVARGHEAMLEHSWLSVRFVTDRAIANEIVRHRLFSFAQESTRYCNYGNRGFEFVMPPIPDSTWSGNVRQSIEDACRNAAEEYEAMVRCASVRPEIARAVLPLCTATSLVVSGNLREWRHFFRLRTAKDAHPQIRELATPLLHELQGIVPVVFDDIKEVS